MIIAKIVKPFPYDLYWAPYNDWLWKAIVSISSDYTPPAEYTTLGYVFEGYNTATTEIGQVFVDNIQYTQTSSIASCTAIIKSWFFDIPTQTFYVHPVHSVRMDSSDFDSLESNGYTSETVFTDSSGFVFKPYLTSDITIADSADRGVYQKMSFVSNTLQFQNQINYDHVGEFDYAFVSKVPGADVKIFYISPEDLASGKTTLTPLYTGFVESEKITRDTYTIKMADKREQLNGKYPNTYFNTDDYPDMDNKVAGKLISEGYGDLTGVTAYCTNGGLTSGDVTYKYASDGTVLTTVYVYDKDAETWEEVTPTSSSATDCTFTLATGDGRDTNGRYLKAKVDCTLREQKTPSQIIADMITRYLGYPFNSEYFDFGSWTDEGSLLGNIAVLFDKRDNFFKLIEPMQTGSTVPFIFRVNENGKFKIIVDDIAREISERYQAIENYNDDRTVSTDFTQYATDAVINYAKDWDSGDYQSTTYDTYKSETLDTYRYEQELEFDTYLTNPTEAAIRAEINLKDFKKARPKHTIIIRGVLDKIGLFSVVNYDSRIGDRGYAGNVKIKTNSYKYDLKNNLTILTGFDISDIISKDSTVKESFTPDDRFSLERAGLSMFPADLSGDMWSPANMTGFFPV